MEDSFRPAIDTLWGRPSLAWHIQPGLNEEGQAALAKMQRLVLSHWPAPLHAAPASALHVTIYSLVPIRSAFDKGVYWNAIRAPALELLSRAGAAATPFELRFTGLRVRPDAIIAVAEDPSGVIARLREAIVRDLPPPPGQAPLRYDLIHATLARYGSAAPVPRSAVRAVEAAEVDVGLRVERLRLVRETLYPCLRIEELASVGLGRPPVLPSGF
jgi:hypothetical protein